MANKIRALRRSEEGWVQRYLPGGGPRYLVKYYVRPSLANESCIFAHKNSKLQELIAAMRSKLRARDGGGW